VTNLDSNKQKLVGKVALITGASQGLGYQIAKRFANEGANLIICSRSKIEIKDVVSELSQNFGNDQRIYGFDCDVSVQADVDRLFQLIEKKFGNLDVLVNNAGIYGPLGPIEDSEWSKWVKAIEVNLIGSAYVMRKSIEVMKKQNSGKIIQLSGGGATQPHPNASSYAASKAAVVRLAETLALEVAVFGIEINSIAPGAMNTRLFEQVIEAGADLVGKEFYEKTLKQRESGGSGFDSATSLAVFLACGDSDGISGKLISAIWDDWEHFPRSIEALNSSDIYTIRRITEQERPNVI
jgi:NAD(P)-dependent dehydrogenase (short-subunit alcohol dehydrogenase family)